jgi:hypothetical protein
MTTELDKLNKVLDAHVSDSVESLLTVETSTTTKEEKLHGAMSEEVVDNMSEEYLELTEELHGETVILELLKESTQDVDQSLTSVEKHASLLFRKQATNLVAKGTD